MQTLLDLLVMLANLFFLPLNNQDIRARRRKEIEALDRRKPKEWERLV